MKIQTRIKPESDKVVRIVRIIGIVIIPFGAYGLSYESVSGFAGAVVAVGGIMLVISYLVDLSPSSYRNVFRRSNTVTQAKVIHRKKVSTKDSKDGTEGGDAGGGDAAALILFLVLLLFAWIWEKRHPDSYTYTIVIQFDAARLGSEVEKVALSMRVPQDTYNRYPIDSIVSVRYAKENPCLAILEGEEDWS